MYGQRSLILLPILIKLFYLRIYKNQHITIYDTVNWGEQVLYQFDDDIVSVGLSDINENILSFGFINFKQLKENYMQFGFSLQSVEKCSESSSFFSSDIEVFDKYCFVKLSVVNVTDVNVRHNCFAIFIRKNLLLVVNISDDNCANRNTFMRALSKISCENVSLEKLVCAFFESLISGDNKALEKAELEINQLEETVLKSRADSNFNMRLLEMKKELLTLRGYYEQLIDISEALRENENEVFESNGLKAFNIFTDKAVRLKENVDLLRDSVVHLWDAYQAYLNMKLNLTMKVFTLMTTVFYPITVIVGWYGMNFDYMPELGWRYGYVYVMVLCAVLVFSLLFWFKKKKWF